MNALLTNTAILTSLILALIPGCARVQFQDGKSARENFYGDEGFEYYPPQPYVVITSTKEGSQVGVISLPNLSRPMRVRQIPGWGTTQLQVASANGIITAINSQNDSKASETLNAVLSGAGGILSGIGSIAAAGATADAADSAANAQIVSALITAISGAVPTTGAAADPSRTATIKEVVAFVVTLATVQDALAPIMNEDAIDQIKEVLVLIAEDLEQLAVIEFDSGVPQDIVDKFEAAKKQLPRGLRDISSRLVVQRDELEKVQPSLKGAKGDHAKKALEKLSGLIMLINAFIEPGGGSKVQLYRVDETASGIDLVRVKLN